VASVELPLISASLMSVLRIKCDETDDGSLSVSRCDKAGDGGREDCGVSVSCSCWSGDEVGDRSCWRGDEAGDRACRAEESRCNASSTDALARVGIGDDGGDKSDAAVCASDEADGESE
jgi:hypothetical protein